MNQEAAAPALREALEKINEWVCYASEEDVNAKPMAMQQIGVIARAALAARPADPVEPTSVEQSALIDEELAKRGWPANMKNASRAGWAACLRYLATPAEPTTLPSSRERWNAENPGELSFYTFDDDATPAEPPYSPLTIELAQRVQQAHEWGYRGLVGEGFIKDNAPLDLANYVLSLTPLTSGITCAAPEQ